MRTLVCVKPVPDPNLVEYDIISEEFISVLWGIYGADLCALEEACRIKEEYGGEIVVLSASPPRQEIRGEDVLNKVFFYGADRAIRIWHEDFSQADTFTTSAIMACEISKHDFDLVICGYKSGDTGSECFGALLSEKLNLPLVTRIVNLDLGPEKETITVDKKLEKGRRETFLADLPAVVTVDNGINQPRYVAVCRKIEEGLKKKIEMTEPDGDLIGLSSATEVLGVGQWKSRTRATEDMSGLSTTDMMKMLRGERGDKKKKQIFSGSPAEVAKDIGDTLVEWIY